MTPATRKRRNAQIELCRQRQAEGKVRLAVVVDEVALIEVLRIAGFIEPAASDPEKPELQALLERVIQLWIEPPDPAM
jgi:hypothetical protein